MLLGRRKQKSSAKASAAKFGRTLYLHIGNHRTGTTSIQSFLRSNAPQLAEEGIILPSKSGRHRGVVKNLFTGAKSPERIATELNKRAERSAHPCRAIIVSDEDISTHASLKVFGELRAFFDVKVIFSLRRQDLWLESWYFQNIKWQWNKKLAHASFDEFLDQRRKFHWIDYQKYLTHLEEVFGRENILLNVFEREQMPDGPVVAFCKALGLEDMTGFSEPPHVNSSMSAQMVEFTRHLPLDQFETTQREVLRKALAAVDERLKGSVGGERVMPYDQRVAVLGEYEAGNRAVARQYFGRDALFTAALPDKDAPLAKLELPATSAELIEKIVAPVLTELVESGALGKRD